MKFIILAVIVALTACSSPVYIEDKACEEHRATLFTANEQAVKAYGASKIEYAYVGPYFGYDSNDAVITVFYTRWLECETIPGTKREA